MPIINPFASDWIHKPTKQDLEAQKELTPLISKVEEERIKQFLDCPSWKCPSCGSTVFGRTKICPFNQNGIYCRTEKPK